MSPLGGHLEAILDHLGALLGRHVGLCRAVLKPSKSDAKTRSMKAPFFDDVCSEIAIFGTQAGVLDLLSTRRKAPLFFRGRGIVFLSVIPALPSPLPLALTSHN